MAHWCCLLSHSCEVHLGGLTFNLKKGIMVCHLWVTPLLVFYVVLLQAEENVFLEREHASKVFGRVKRANPFLFPEELWEGNLERECVEELCSYDEAFEIFEDVYKTDHYWKTYRGNPCLSQPCQHGGICTAKNDKYKCQCLSGIVGDNCEIVASEDCGLYNGHCEQFCSDAVERDRVQCSCTKGYTLGRNRKSCIPAEQFTCGKRYITEEVRSMKSHRDNANITKAFSNIKRNYESATDDRPPYAVYRPCLPRQLYCKPGQCPWQAILVNDNNESFCGGTILDQHFVLTSAHCINETTLFHVVVGVLDLEDRTDSIHTVDIIYVHSKFDRETYDYDIALIKLKEAMTFSAQVVPACIPEVDFAEQVLMTQDYGYASIFSCAKENQQCNSNLQLHVVPYISSYQCSNHNHSDITENMFCAGSDIMCQEAGGGSHITPYKNTYFVTGIASWQKRSENEVTYGVFTKVSKFIKWIKALMCYV